MEESITLLNSIQQTFHCEENDIKSYSPLTLAFIGDAIFELVIRTVVVERGNRATNGLHKTKSGIVNAVTQSKMVQAMESLLTEEERAYYRRGRNAKSYTKAKNAPTLDYRKATGLEALCGYWYLTNQMERMLALIEESLKLIDCIV